MKVMKAIAVARVSQREQQVEGYSLQAQARLLNDYAIQKEISVVKSFDFPESASSSQQRKTFQQILEYLSKHPEIKIQLWEKVDRATRNFQDAVILDEWLNEDEERQIHFVKQGLVMHKNAKSHEKFQWDIQVAMARQYTNNLSEEVKKGLDEKARQGYWPGNHKMGYVSLGEVGRKEWSADKSNISEAPYIKKAFELYNTGNYTLRTLSAELYLQGWRIEGKPISIALLHKILRDCFYCGEFMWKSQHFTEAKHEPLISKELFYSVQERLRRKITGKYIKHDFLYGGGLLICGECGRSVTGEVQKGHHYYSCTKYKTSCIQKSYVREESIEEQIIDTFDKIQIKNNRLLEWVRKALKESHQDERQYHDQTVGKLNEEYKRIQHRLDVLYDDKLDGKISVGFYESKYNQYKEQQKSVLEALGRHKQANFSYFEMGSNIFELAQKAKSIYQNAKSTEEKRQLLNFVFSNLKMKDKKIDPTYKNAFQIVASRIERATSRSQSARSTPELHPVSLHST